MSGEAIGGAAIIGGVGAYMGGQAQADAAKSAANSQAASNAQSLNVQKQMFDKQVALNQPWQDAGLKALGNYADNPAFKFSYNDLTADPSYQFRTQQGINALDASASSRGKLLSGAQDKALLNYGQGQASTEYQNAYNRSLQDYNTNANTQLNVANIGRGAAGQTQNAMQNYSSGAANTIQATGNAMAQGQIGAGNAQANAYSGIGNSINQGIGNATLYNMYNTSQYGVPATGNISQFSNVYGG